MLRSALGCFRFSPSEFAVIPSQLRTDRTAVFFIWNCMLKSFSNSGRSHTLGIVDGFEELHMPGAIVFHI